MQTQLTQIQFGTSVWSILLNKVGTRHIFLWPYWDFITLQKIEIRKYSSQQRSIRTSNLWPEVALTLRPFDGASHVLQPHSTTNGQKQVILSGRYGRLKRLLPNVLIYAYAQKNTDMRIKNTHMRIKFLLSLVCFILPFTEHAHTRMHVSACVFLRLTKKKIRTRYAYFSAIYKERFLRYEVLRLRSVVVMGLVCETINVGSVLTKSETFMFTNVIDFFL